MAVKILESTHARIFVGSSALSIIKLQERPLMSCGTKKKQNSHRLERKNVQKSQTISHTNRSAEYLYIIT